MGIFFSHMKKLENSLISLTTVLRPNNKKKQPLYAIESRSSTILYISPAGQALTAELTADFGPIT